MYYTLQGSLQTSLQMFYIIASDDGYKFWKLYAGEKVLILYAGENF